MSNCPSCQHPAAESDNFCSACGRPLTKGVAASDFEIGKIAALDTIKKDILVWIGAPAAIIGALFTILAYFGITDLIKTRVSDEVNQELRSVQKDITDTEKVIFTNQGKSERDQEQISLILKGTNAKLATLEEQNTLLQKAIGETIGQKDALVDAFHQLNDAFHQLNIEAFIDKLHYDFYHVRQFSGKVIISFNETLDRLPSAHYEENLVVAGGDETKRRKLGELHNEGARVLINSMQVQDHLILFPQWEEHLLQQPISEFEDLNTFTLSLSVRQTDRDELDKLVAKIGDLQVMLLVNWMPLWSITMNNDDIWHLDQQHEGIYQVKFQKKITLGGKPIVTKYEELFQETKYREMK